MNMTQGMDANEKEKLWKSWVKMDCNIIIVSELIYFTCCRLNDILYITNRKKCYTLL